MYAHSSPARSTQDQKQQICPNCGDHLPVNPGYVTWCEVCNWNIQPHQEIGPRNTFESFYAALGQKLGQVLFNQLAQQPVLKPGLTTAKILALLLAGVVHATTLGLAGLGVWLIIKTWPAWLLLLIGLLFIALAWE